MDEVTQNTADWKFEVIVKRGMITNEVTDSDGKTVFNETTGDIEKKKFMVKRVYLVCASEKYGATIVYNINKPNRSKKAPFFTDRKTKKQYFVSTLTTRLQALFGNRTGQVINAALAQL